jgi:replicative DNA helicase
MLALPEAPTHCRALMALLDTLPAKDDLTARALPANVEAEAAFLGAVLIDNRVIEELPTQLVAAHFFEPVHARIYERIGQLLDRGAVVTPVTLRPYFESDEALRSWAASPISPG